MLKTNQSPAIHGTVSLIITYRQLVNAVTFGVPQIRKRVVLMAVRSRHSDCSTATDTPLILRHRLHYSHFVCDYWDRLTLSLHQVRSIARQKSFIRTNFNLLSPRLPWQTVRDAYRGTGQNLSMGSTSRLIKNI